MILIGLEHLHGCWFTEWVRNLLRSQFHEDNGLFEGCNHAVFARYSGYVPTEAMLCHHTDRKSVHDRDQPIFSAPRPYLEIEIDVSLGYILKYGSNLSIDFIDEQRKPVV